MPYMLYIASVLGALALYMMMPRRGYTPAKAGGLLGAGVLGGAWLYLSDAWGASLVGDSATAIRMYYYVFSAIAIIAAVRVITHRKPVYAALWFVMVVLASAGLFLVLDAEFMAFAMVIIYAGAILVTYVFVIMLASDPDDQPAYDSAAREPVAAVSTGFLLLAVLLTVAFGTLEPNPAAAAPTDRQIVDHILTKRPATRMAGQLEHAEQVDTAVRLSRQIAPVDRVDNIERIGLDLFESHPLGLELAGVILLVALVGAVIIARKQVGEENKESNVANNPSPPGSVP